MVGQEAADYQPIITSHDGYSSYLLVVDAFTSASFVFLAKSKSPPIETIAMFLDKYGIKEINERYMHTDQGGELARLKDFPKTVRKYNYTIETTGAGNSSQNGRGKRPHWTYHNMVRYLLYIRALLVPNFDTKY